MVRGYIASFYRSAGREAPIDFDMDGLVGMALADWQRIPDADLGAVCARARILAAQKPGNFPATTGEVLKAWNLLSEEHHRMAYQREQERLQADIKAGRLLPEPTLAEMSEEGRRAALADFRKSAGLE